MFIDWTIPLIIGVIGGPLAVLVKVWYKKKPGGTSKFADNGTYVRDDSLYSYDESGPRLSKDNDSHNKNNS